MGRTLVPWRRGALAVVASCVLVVVAGGVAFHGDAGVDRFDARAYGWVHDHVDASVLVQAIRLTTPWAVITLTAVTTAVAALLRRYRLALLAGLGPLAAVVLTEYVLKPLVHRTVGSPPGGAETYAYPSGHETGLSSLTLLLVLVLFGLTRSRAVLIGALVVALLVDAVAAVALVGLRYHFATDTIAAVGVSGAVVVGLALLLDARPRAQSLSAPGGSAPSSTARGA